MIEQVPEEVNFPSDWTWCVGQLVVLVGSVRDWDNPCGSVQSWVGAVAVEEMAWTVLFR